MTKRIGGYCHDCHTFEYYVPVSSFFLIESLFRNNYRHIIKSGFDITGIFVINMARPLNSKASICFSINCVKKSKRSFKSNRLQMQFPPFIQTSESIDWMEMRKTLLFRPFGSRLFATLYWICRKWWEMISIYLT